MAKPYGKIISTKMAGGAGDVHNNFIILETDMDGWGERKKGRNS